MRLHIKLTLLIVSLLFFVILLVDLYLQSVLESSLKEQIGTRAIQVAHTVAAIPDITKAFAKEKPWETIQPIAEDVRKRTGAEFVVVGNADGIRYSHPVPSRIGRNMEGGDNDSVFKGQEIISEAKGSLGPSLRGKVPIFNGQGKVIGVVSVGFPIDDIQAVVNSHRIKTIGLGLIALFLGIAGAVLISRSVKRGILGLEPEEITHLYQEKEAVLESIKEGVIAVDAKGIITTLNKPASRILQWSSQDAIGKNITLRIPDTPLLKVIREGKAEFDQEMMVSDESYIVNRLPIFDKQGKVTGAVSSFRSKSELYRVTQELSQLKQYAEALRAQTHEYFNKLHMISGLIQLGSYKEVVDFIKQESDIHQDLLQFIMKQIPDGIIGGLIIGKFNKANECKIELAIDRESSLKDIPVRLDRECLITIIGNLIDNAIDAVLQPGASMRKVNLSFTDYGKDFIIEVEDFGVGISSENVAKIFEKGYSTKSEPHHGFGLYLVKQALEKLHGYISYARNEAGGSIFTVVIPKNIT